MSQPVTHAYTVLHYGLDYLPYALRSIYDAVDQIHVLHTPHPSHGHQAGIPAIESGDDLRRAAYAYDPDGKIHWYNTTGLYYEGQQRDTAVNICRKAGAEMIVVLDYDEVWHADTLRAAIDYAWQVDAARNWLINFTHLWRSFDWCCRDDAWPVRLIDLRHRDGTGYIPRELGEIYHFGYAITDKVLRYKLAIHGHHDEMRPDWLTTKWAAEMPVEDCHPTNGRKTNGEGYWTTEPFDKARLPELMRAHPWYDVGRIE